MKASTVLIVGCALMVASTVLAEQRPTRERESEGEHRPEGFFARLDTDGDGAVSHEEFDGPDDHFQHLDRDGDGFINGDEAPRRPPPRHGDGRSESFITRLDRDGDAQVSLDEFAGPDDHFDHMDRNGDGFIDSSEAPVGPPERPTRENSQRRPQRNNGVRGQR